MNNIMDAMTERAHKRRAQYAITVVDSFPPLKNITAPMILGTYSRTATAGKRGARIRIIKKMDSITIDGMTETPTAIARDYLTASKLRPRRVRGEDGSVKQSALRENFAPGFARPCSFDDGVYIDIKAAYYSILKITGWNVGYKPGSYLMAGDVMRFPFVENHIARNSLVSCARPHTVCKVNPPGGAKNITDEWMFNQWLNLQLCAIVSDTLHTIASLAQQAGAVYVNTDGYIATSETARRSIAQIISDFGLSYSVKHAGAGLVAWIGGYTIGDYSTHNEPRAHRGARPRNNIADISTAQAVWLQRQMDFWAGKRL